MSWTSIFGQDPAIRFFQNAWKKDRLAHGYLLVGPSGVGKHTFALEFAKAILCKKVTDTLEACDDCSSCHLCNGGTHPDLLRYARPEDLTTFPIELIRDLSAQLSLKPARGKRKIAVLDDADDMDDNAANAFLKTLEEPPPGSILLLVGGSSAATQLQTIVSRCQVVRFAPLSLALMRSLLEKEEGIEPALIDRVLRSASGSMGRALQLMDETLWNFRSDLLKTLSEERTDSVALGTRWFQFIEDGKTGTPRQRTTLTCQLALDIFQNALRCQCGVLIPEASVSDLASYQKIANRWGEGLIGAMERILQCEKQININGTIALIIEALSDALIHKTIPKVA